MRILRFIVLTLSLALAAVCSSPAETVYGEDLAWRLANPGEIRRVTTIKARLRREKKEADPLFILTPPPFEDISAAPNKLAGEPQKVKSWEIPPWPALDPPLPANASEAEKRLYQERQKETATPDVWAELDAPGGEKEAPSALLRPRKVSLDEQFVFRIKEIPEPFSLRRYYDTEDVFIEIAAYGGTTSFKAEEAFRALKEAATRQTKLEGIGDEAFLTRIEVLSEQDDPDYIPFEEVAVVGDERPELLDSGSAEALAAPAFQDVPVKDLEGRRITYVEPHKRYRGKESEVEQSLLVIVAFFPDEALTVSFALEERLGSVQDLIAMAMMAQRKLKTEIERRG